MNALDAKVGDGDTGSTLANLAKKIQHYSDRLPYANVKEMFESVGRICAR